MGMGMGMGIGDGRWEMGGGEVVYVLHSFCNCDLIIRPCVCVHHTLTDSHQHWTRSVFFSLKRALGEEEGGFG